MSQRSLLAALAGLVLACGVANAQTPAPEKTFNLKKPARADTTAQVREAAKPAWKPALEPGRLEASISLGYLNLSTPLVSHANRLIYRYTAANYYFGDIVLKGSSAFNPVLRLGYDVKRWFTLEGVWGISVSEYKANISNTVSLSTDPANNERISGIPLGEFDAEQRSCITVNSGLNGIIYPFDLKGDGTGRLHHFLLGGYGRTWYSLNSNYTLGSTAAWTLTGGAGLRFIADDLISIRIEALYNRSTIQFKPAETWQSLNEGTLLIPLYELPAQGDIVPVTEFNSESIGALSWAIGFTARF
ncbi:MAG: hypothetical protein ACYDIE_14825 [Candidatus Krumholzibacteriia bacterium]